MNVNMSGAIFQHHLHEMRMYFVPLSELLYGMFNNGVREAYVQQKPLLRRSVRVAGACVW